MPSSLTGPALFQNRLYQEGWPQGAYRFFQLASTLTICCPPPAAGWMRTESGRSTS